MIKKYFSKKAFLSYLANSLSGSLLGFLIGMWATSLISRFFETRNIYNLWGFKSKKTLISKAAFENMEWIISIVIGFFVFEFFDKVVKVKLKKELPVYYKKGMDYLRENGWLERAENLKAEAVMQVRKMMQRKGEN